MAETQLAKMICEKIRSIMKFTLSLEEYSYRENGRNDPRYKTFKQQLMANTYENTRELLKSLESLGLISKVEDVDEDVKGGFKDSPSGGSGFINSEDFDDWLNS